MAAGLPFQPLLPAAAAVIMHQAGAQGILICLFVHIGHHQHLAVFRILNDHGNQALGILFQILPGEGGPPAWFLSGVFVFWLHVFSPIRVPHIPRQRTGQVMNVRPLVASIHSSARWQGICCLEASLGAEYIRDAGIQRGGFVQCLGERLEHGFNHVMVVARLQHPQMQVHARAVGDGIEKLFHKLRVQLPHPLCREITCKLQIGPAAQVHGAQSQGFIHGQDKIAVAPDALFVSGGLPDGLSQHNTGVLHRVVTIHLQIPFHLTFQVKKAMSGKSLQHMVEKTNAGVYLRPAAAVQIQSNLNVGLPGPAVNCTASCHKISFPLILPINDYCSSKRTLMLLAWAVSPSLSAKRSMSSCTACSASLE